MSGIAVQKGPPSALKEKVAQMIRGAFAAGQVECLLYPGDFRIPSGSWRRGDVYRWQIYVQLHDGERWTRAEISSWDTLTQCGRSGIDVRPSGLPWSYEADAKHRDAAKPDKETT